MLRKFKNFILNFIFKYFPNYFCRFFSYSQDGEDMVLRSFYEEAYKYKGFYVDIGAHHPFRFSNTAYFYQQGWRGINVEPAPSLYKNFPKYRRRDINLNVGISDRIGKLRFFMFKEPAVNTFDPVRAKVLPFENERYILEKELEIQTQPLKYVLDTYLPKGTQIDFFSIDVEGLDLEVLHSNDWNTYNPRFVLVEHDFNILEITKDPIFSFLHSLNYDLVARTKRTSIFISNKNS